MEYYSTNNPQLRVQFKEAVFKSLPPDGGLYMPMTLPKPDPMFWRNLPGYSLPEIAEEVAGKLVGDAIPPTELRKIVREAFDFEVPLKPLDPGLGVLELFHGPSLAFKDFGARFMSRVMGYLSHSEGKVLDVLVATSGDTGGAVALGFEGVPGTRVTILYPKGKVSPVQELQLTTNGANIRTLEIEGNFDDCQALVKQAFLDPEINRVCRLTSANSINIARLIPQMLYYFYAYAQARMQGLQEVVFSVPSGNFGNVAAGLMASHCGLPVRHFIAATNVNDTVPRYLASGEYSPQPAIPTLSNAMDVGAPSNWARIADLYKGDRQSIQKDLSAVACDDAETLEAIEGLFSRYGYLACPHTAIAWKAAADFRMRNPGSYAAVFFATAHPCKFPEVYTGEQVQKIVQPASIDSLQERQRRKTGMSADFAQFKEFLLQEA